MKAYLVVEYPLIQDLEEDQVVDDEFELPSFIVGVFNKKSIARKVAKDLFDRNGDFYFYVVDEYEVNQAYVKTEEEAFEHVSESIEKMVKDGYLDYKIGEDGDFYFEVTEKGRTELQ